VVDAIENGCKTSKITSFLKSARESMLKQLILAAGLVALSATPSFAVEKRCGWLSNPTPGNWFLTDRDRTWDIGLQGGFQAKGIDTISDLSARPNQYVRTNGSYGYACACMDVIADKSKGRITRIQSMKQLPLRQCRTDPALPRMER
jgi:Protein of unknown function (DUF4087)